jgi:hypothetical protein
MKLTTSAFALLFTIALAGSAAHAELFRCTGPDGKTIFTDQKHTCPGAEPTEPTGVVHRAETPEIAPAAPSRDQHAPDVVSEAAQWKQKKRDAELQLEELRKHREWLDRVANNCNRPGRYVVKRDDAGIKQMANCSELKQELADVETQEAAARDYLATGLAEECRRAGCLPGWVR